MSGTPTGTWCPEPLLAEAGAQLAPSLPLLLELGARFTDAGHEVALVGGPVRDAFLSRASTPRASQPGNGTPPPQTARPPINSGAGPSAASAGLTHSGSVRAVGAGAVLTRAVRARALGAALRAGADVALVVMAVVLAVGVAVVEVVHVVTVLNSVVAAIGAVLVGVLFVLGVRHDASFPGAWVCAGVAGSCSRACATASATMWVTWSSMRRYDISRP